MSRVREVIELLTNVFQENGIVTVKAECFRAAKFDKNEVTEPLWRLLFELIYISKYRKLEDYLRDFVDQLKQEEVVIYTKNAMQECGYLCGEFSNLPDDMSSGSRELLLAIGWLLSTKKVVDKFVDLQMLTLDQEFPPQEPVIVEQRPACTKKLGAVQKVQQLQLENGHLSLSLKSLYTLYCEEARLQHRIHENTTGVSTLPSAPHLSVMEVFLLRHPEQLKKCIKQIEKDNGRLEKLLQWKEHEHIFWKWMESVLYLKMEEAERDEKERNKQVVHYNIPAELLGCVSLSRRNLESAIMKFEPVITQLEEIWEIKQQDIDEGQVKRIESAVDSDIELHCQNLSDVNISHAPLYRNSRLMFIKPSQKKISNVQIPTSLNISCDGSSEPVEIQSQIEKLQKGINRLECEIQRKENFYRKHLDTLASHIQDAICIQPASLTR